MVHLSERQRPPRGARVLAVVVTYNGMEWIDRCLGALGDSPQVFHTVVIDNGSTDGTPAHIRGAFPDVELIEAGENLGFGAANNVGFRRALDEGATHVFLLNQDAWPNAGCLRELLDASERQPEFGVISPLHLDGSGKRFDRPFFQKLIRNADYVESVVLGKEWHGGLVEVPFVNAAAWLVTRECLERVGGFNSAFFHYGEDRNYCQRVLDRGLKVGICPEATICHDRDGTVKVLSPERRKEWQVIQDTVAIMNPANSRGRFSPVPFAARGLLKALRHVWLACGDSAGQVHRRHAMLREYRTLRDCRAEQTRASLPFLGETPFPEDIAEGPKHERE